MSSELAISTEPSFSSQHSGDIVRLILDGNWTIEASRAIEVTADQLVTAAGEGKRAVLDLARVGRMDTAGAWLIDRVRQTLIGQGIPADIERLRPEYALLLKEAHFRRFEETAPPRGNFIITALADTGNAVVNIGRDIVSSVAFLGDVVAAFGGLALRPRGFRLTSLVFHIESFGFRSVPIIVLINFLVGAIVAQQGLFQLRQFGAETFAVNLIGILVLRELAVILTSIMVAGRSGSAITAELGSMKMREEIDALKVMGLSPVEVLILPRLLALIISLPLLTFLADLAALFGGLCVAWGYGGISPEAFMSRLQTAIGFNTFFTGLIKAPFMALVIGLIASVEGLAVQGSAESLGRQVTSSVVKSIFMVIVVDGVFAMFFAGIHF
jgi:phospholipid/cholesterol/gamma-HCH transport system permease protein